MRVVGCRQLSQGRRQARSSELPDDGLPVAFASLEGRRGRYILKQRPLVAHAVEWVSVRETGEVPDVRQGALGPLDVLAKRLPNAHPHDHPPCFVCSEDLLREQSRSLDDAVSAPVSADWEALRLPASDVVGPTVTTRPRLTAHGE